MSHIARLTASCMMMTILFGGAASADSITVTAERLNMRKEADASSKAVSVVEKDDELSFVSEVGDWYQVRLGEKTGYVMKEYVEMDLTGLEEDVAANTEAYSASATAVNRVNMRSLPITDADVVKVVDKSDNVEIIGRAGDWYQVSYSGKTGYIMAQYLNVGGGSSENTVSAPAQTAETVYAEAKTGVTTARVNMRKSASTGAGVAKVVSRGGSVTVLGESGSWYKVTSGGKTGYIMKSYVSLNGASDSGSASGEQLYGDAVTGKTTERVNLREEASTSSDVEKVVAKGQSLTVLGESGDWYRVKVGSREGYILKSYIQVTGGTDSEDEDETVDAVVPDGFVSYPAARTGRTTDRVNLRKAASTGADVEKILDEGAGLTVLGEQGSFYQVKAGGTIGYVSKSYVTLGTAGGSSEDAVQDESDLDETMYSSTKTLVTTVRVNMRKEPEGDVLHTLSADTKVTVIGEAGSWYKVIYSSSTGYISKAYMTEEIASAPEEPEDNDGSAEITGKGTTAYITGNSVNMRKGAGTGYGVVKVLSKGDEIAYYSEADGWYLIKAGDDAGYVSAKYVSTAKPDTAPANPGDDDEDASVGKVQMADWWTSDIQKIFKVGVIATVTDVDTGISWQVKRSGGSNHADVQPLTAADTAKMKQAYGGTWSWNRRAIWVTIDGVSYAASMNGMPHGSGSIKDNNFDGHHCIHFLNSRTHTGNRWDTAHQAAVQKAYKAGQ